MSMMLDTRAVSPADRPEYWSAGIAEHFFPMQVESFGPTAFEARLSGGEVGPVAVRTISGRAHRAVRTARMVARADPESILFYIVRRGVCRIEQDGRACELRAGDLGSHDTSRPSSFEARAGFDVMILTMPKWFLGTHADTVAARAAERVAGAHTPLLRLASPLLAGLERMAQDVRVDAADGDAAAEMLLPVIRTLYREEGHLGSGERSTLLQSRMRQFALSHLHDADLGPERIARAHYVSTRYVHKLFAPYGGVSAWIRTQRLERAAHELQTTGMAVSEIAGRWGYRDAASFSRAFRKVRGHSPRELRLVV